MTNLLKSLIHNLGVLLVGLFVGYVGIKLDLLLSIAPLRSRWWLVAGGLLLTIGFLLRVWATFYFYQRRMKVISLAPQRSLITSGPYRISRNPLYLGGNVLIFCGASLLMGSPAALIITAVHLPLVDLMIRREEKQLQLDFGEHWMAYKRRVRRWI
jgi:protein-S-isoprenylcysteine O-methyltransferase Ste14